MMARGTPLPLSLLAACVAWALTPMAHGATDADKESTLVVLGSADGASSSYINSATKSSAPEIKTPQTVDTIERGEIEKRHAQSLNEILRYDAGVATEMRGSTTYMSEYKLRGFSVDHEYYDGLQLPYNVSGNTKASIDPILIERVNILKGPSSVLYGSASPGGLVNIVGKKPQQEQKTEVGFNTGNRALKEGYFDSTGQIAASDWLYRFIGKASERNDQPYTTKNESYLLAPSAVWHASDKTTLTLEALWQNQPNLTPSNPLPLAYLRSGYASRRAYAGDKWNGFEQRQGMLGYSLDHEFDNGWGVMQKARYFNVDTHQKSVYATGTGGSDTRLSRYGYTTDEDLDSFNIDNQVRKSIDLGGWRHNLLAGFDYQHLNSHFDYKYGAVLPPDMDMQNPDYSQVSDGSLALYQATLNRLSYNQSGYYLQDQVEYGRLNLIGSVRYDKYRSVTTDYMNDSAKQYIDQDRVTKRLGALYRFDNGLSPYVSYSEGFMPVSPTGTLTAAQAKPTTSRQLEGGVKYLLADYLTTFTVAAFNIRQKNVLTTDYTYDANYQLNYRQTGEVTSKGVEVAAVSRPTENINLIANYAYIDAINTQDDLYQGKRPVQVPQNAANLWGDYTFSSGMLNGLMLGAGLRYTGKTAVSQDNASPALGGNTQYDMALSYDMGVVASSLKGLSVKASAQNLTNRFTYTCYSTSYCWIGRDRTYQVGLNYVF